MKKVNVIAEYGVKTDYNKLDEWQKKAHPYTVTLKYDKKQMTIPFFMGIAHSHEPTDKDVMPCLVMDYYSVTNYSSFEEFCEEFGYDTDSRQAEKTYKQCKKQAKKFEKLLGADLDNICALYEEH